MEEPSVFLFKEHDELYELYLGEYSTIQGLNLFDNHQKIKVLKAGGSEPLTHDWIDESHFQKIVNKNALVKYLEDNQHIDWVDIDISIEGFGRLSTHDDGECHFKSYSKKLLMTLVQKSITNRDSIPVEIELTAYPNTYIKFLKSGNITRYKTFNDYINSEKEL